MKPIHPSTVFLFGLNKSDEAWLQYQVFRVIRRQLIDTKDPAAVIAEVVRQITLESGPKCGPMLDRLDRLPEDALALAAHDIQQASRAPEDRKAEKEAKAKFYARQWRLNQPATEPQLKLLDTLGVRKPVGSKQEAMDILSEMLPQKRSA